MDRILLKLLRLFHDHVPDRKSNVAVTKLISNESRWIEAHDMFSEVRDRVLRATGDAGRPKVPAHLIDHALVS